MTDLEKAARQALEALEVATTPLAKDRQEVLRAITALREALEEPDYKALYEKAVEQYNDLAALMAEKKEQQEPVACLYGDNGYACCEGGPCAAEEHNDKTDWQERGMVAEAALAKLLDEKDEPVAVVSGYYGGQCVILPIDPARIFNSNTALYTRPQAREPLTDAEIKAVRKAVNIDPDDQPEPWSFSLGFRAAEQHHGIKSGAATLGEKK